MRSGFNLEKDSDVAAFVKNERYFEDGKAPRMIMGRNPKFNIMYAQIIEPTEHAFFKLPQVANACDYEKCGRRFGELVGQHFIERDYSSYEATQRLFALKIEYMFYCKLHPQSTEIIDRLFAAKILKIVHTQAGVSCQFECCRGSGDLDTSLGNGLLNYVAIQYDNVLNFCPNCTLSMCNEPNCLSYAFTVKGDDSYSKMPVNADHVDHVKDFGFKTKMVYRQMPEQVEFCSGHFVEVRPGKWMYVQKLQKLIESLTTCINEDVMRNGWQSHYYTSLGKMYKVLYGNMPVYRDIANFLLETSNLGVNVNLVSSYNLLAAFSSSHDDIGNIDESQSRLQISMVNKMDYAELQRIEKWFQNHKLTFPPEMSRRCNIKSKKETIAPVLDYNLLNTLLLTSPLSRRINQHYKKLRRCRVLWERVVTTNDLGP
jgi:hypothetical protein